MVHTGQFLRELASWTFGEKRWKWLYEEQGGAVPETHTLTPAVSIKDTVEWLEWRGYKVALIQPIQQSMEIPQSVHGPYPFAGVGLVGKSGVIFGRKNEPLILAQVGDVLVWDGQNVTIQE
jgi:hypothetical protein